MTVERPHRLVARARRTFAQRAFRLALGPVSGTVPREYVRSIVEHAGQSPMEDHLDDMTVLRPAYVEEYPFDASLPPQFRRVKAFDQRYLYRLHDVCVSPRTGLCWLPRGPILGESVSSLIGLLGWDSTLLEEPLLRSSGQVKGTVVVLASHGYFHWLLECLPAALHALEEEPDATLLMASDAPNYVREAVELLGVPSLRCAAGPVVAERLILAARDPFSGFVPREDIEVLRRRILPTVAASGCKRAGIYVSRRMSSRSLANESELENEVAQMGLDVVNFQALSLSEQIRLSRDSRIMIGPHGAGLSNLVFGQHLHHVLELFPPHYFNDCYGRLSVSCGISYAPFLSGEATPTDNVARTRAIRSAIGNILEEGAWPREHGCGQR